MQSLALAVISLSLLACVHAARNTGRHATAQQRATCEAEGGYIAATGVGAEGCIHRFADGGAACETNDDCQGLCLAETIPNATHAQRLEHGYAVGRCEAEEHPFGCVSVYREGEAWATPCA